MAAHWRFFRGEVLVSTLAVWLAACRHLPSPPPDAGQSTFRIIEPKGAAQPPPVPNDSEAIQEIGGSLLAPRVEPVYPPVALAHHAGRSVVGVRLTIDTAGKVADLEPSPVVFSTPGPFADAFLAAVESAVAQWRFDPAEILHLERVSDADSSNHQGYWRLARREEVEMQFDVMFTFESGKVVSSPPGPEVNRIR
jgi:hypothetical protein